MTLFLLAMVGATSTGLLASPTPAPAALIGLQDPQQPLPVFRGGVQRVVVAATVRDRRGKPVTDLKPTDFSLFDAGQQRKIADVRNDTSPVSLGLLVDLSGSMGVFEKRQAAHDAASHLTAWLEPVSDRVGLFVFDTGLREISPLGPAPGNVLDQLLTVEPYGATSLFDAIAETGRRLAAVGGTRRAVVALTDGLDNASQLSAAAVSGLASSIDVPVYILLVVSPLDRSGRGTIDDERLDEQMTGRLGDLARWTGGEIFAAIGPSSTSQAARQIVGELRQQYMIVFEPDTRPGWHSIDIRTTKKDLVVRARSGYVVRGRPEYPETH
jgi:VWFA-related protein